TIEVVSREYLLEERMIRKATPTNLMEAAKKKAKSLSFDLFGC
ncbi:unnamed protein product, partial [marine sediment metagenome]